MTIGTLARQADVSPDTVRYYERLGLLPPAIRMANGYRHFDDRSLRRLMVVRRAVAFGFTLKELSVFLAARDTITPPCRQVRRRAEELLADVDQQIRDLNATRRRMRRTLREWDDTLSATAAGQPARLLDALLDPGTTPGCSVRT